MAQQKVTIPIPEDLGPDEREALGKDIVEFIRQRSERGIGVKETSGGRFINVPFPAYSKSYLESLDFKVAGKSKKVNLKLSGDMLIAMDVLKHKKGEIVIGFERGSDENDRAEGNILGTYGTDTPNPRRARNFLGISNPDLIDLISNYTETDE